MWHCIGSCNRRARNNLPYEVTFEQQMKTLIFPFPVKQENYIGPPIAKIQH